MTKIHLPAPGRASGLVDTALCGRGSTFATGDHEAIRRIAHSAVRDGNAEHYCAGCRQRL